MAKKDYYEVLGIEKNTSLDEIKKAYKKLALQYHPDRNKEKGAEEKFKEISEAYAVLSDKEKKSAYDQFGHSGFDQRYSQEDIFRGSNFEDIFGLGYKKNGIIKLNQKRPFVQDLDKYSLDWSLIDVEKFLDRHWDSKKILGFISSRGCPFDCSFCYNQEFNARKWRAHGTKKVINEIKDATGVEIDIEEDGTVYITGEAVGAKKAQDLIEDIVRELKPGDRFEGEVVRVADFGVIVKLGPKSDGLVHVSEIANFRIEKVETYMKVGMKVPVIVKGIDDKGRLKLSIKDADPNFIQKK